VDRYLTALGLASSQTGGLLLPWTSKRRGDLVQERHVTVLAGAPSSRLGRWRMLGSVSLSRSRSRNHQSHGKKQRCEVNRIVRDIGMVFHGSRNRKLVWKVSPRMLQQVVAKKPNNVSVGSEQKKLSCGD
jgi:hypothetical protein